MNIFAGGEVLHGAVISGTPVVRMAQQRCGR